MPNSDAAKPVDAIVSALTQLRGRRGPHRGDHPGHRGDHQGERGRHPGPPWMRMPGPGMHERFGGPARLRLLDVLAQASEPLSISDVAERIGVDQPRASRLVQQGVAMGFLVREVDPADARRSRVALTPEGKHLVRGVRTDRRDAVESALEGFTADERAELARLLTKLAAAWPQR